MGRNLQQLCENNLSTVALYSDLIMMKSLKLLLFIYTIFYFNRPKYSGCPLPVSPDLATCLCVCFVDIAAEILYPRNKK